MNPSKITPLSLIPHSCVRFRSKGRARGYSVVEILAVVVVLGALATLAISKVSSFQSAVTDTKLQSDVTKLNSLVNVYQASGGSLDGATTAQQVIDLLKSKRSAFDAKITVGSMTGREVDLRLATRMQTDNEAATNAARVFWNPSTSKFEIAHSGSGGVAGFILDNNLAEQSEVIESRAATNVTYNSEDGWVWKNENSNGQSAISPFSAPLGTPTTYGFDPTAPDGGASVPVPTALPPPSITPHGGQFFIASFVTSVTISPGLVPSGVSTLMYKVIHADGTSTDWANYSGAITTTYGDSVVARNASTDVANYMDSPLATETYTVKPTVLPVPAITPLGGSYVASNWPAISIDLSGAPGGAMSSILYKISSSSGVSTAWMTYTSPISIYYGDSVTAKNVTLNPQFYSDSGTVVQTYNITGSTKLPPPILTESTDSAGKHWITITPDTSTMPVPAGIRIYYTVNGDDPGIKSSEDPITGKLFTSGSPIAVPTNVDFFEVIARIYPPTADKVHWDTSDIGDIDIAIPGPGLAGGHIDVDTSHMTYALNSGSTDAHVHAYDDKYNVTTVDMMGLLGGKLGNIQKQIPNGIRFKLIVANSNLSPGGLLSINGTTTGVGSYSSTPLASLPTYSLDGAAGTTKLTSLKMNFNTDTLPVGGLIGTVTGSVRSNKVGKLGEYRNGALTIQAVKVNADGSPAFTTNLAQSNGGVQGVAATGLLWECTMFWHWKSGPYH